MYEIAYILTIYEPRDVIVLYLLIFFKDMLGLFEHNPVNLAQKAVVIKFFRFTVTHLKVDAKKRCEKQAMILLQSKIDV